ncbi:aPHC-domain-containing protein [Patellaria atrata CBS 101060]|uniref:APHC-domain-containing protein n=1 Tax=Patellaria atrata CBS 101060 TaxID=1346257 RepID=A0A9P4SET1_9PEZI|nr:aPHC-domain-containing protein [Patellaria atrata CBS 101060]
MTISLPSISYPLARSGYWDPVTSTLNWCEEDYYATIYVAEIVNTFTNAVFILLAYKGIRNCIRNGHATVFLVGFLSYLFIGLGSFLFHMSLKYEMQLLDELSMIYNMCTMFYAVFSFQRSRFAASVVLIFVVSLAAFITAYYHYLKDPVFHQIAFALITVSVVLTSLYRIERYLKPSRRTMTINQGFDDVGRKSGNDVQRDIVERARLERRDTQIYNEIWQLKKCGLGFIAFGFFIWNLDNIFCSTLRRWRHDIGLPWGILLEGHGWWHIMTGLSAYYHLTSTIWLQYCMSGMQDEVKLIWPSLFTSVPVIVRRKGLLGKDGDERRGNKLEDGKPSQAAIVLMQKRRGQEKELGYRAVPNVSSQLNTKANYRTYIHDPPQIPSDWSSPYEPRLYE